MTAVAELTRKREKLIHRMPGRGDLWFIIDSGRRFVRADQLEQMAGIPPWRGEELLFDEGDWFILEGHVCTPIEQAIAQVEAAGSIQAGEFLDWLREVLELQDDDALDQAQPVPSFIGSHPVHVAARILSEDPEVSVGRNALFAFMHAAGWLSRGVADWEITHLAARNGWLTVRQVPVPGRGRRTYPQPYVTPDGLTQLHRLLTIGRRHAPPDPGPHPTLFD